MAEHYCRHCKTCDCDCGQFDSDNCQYCKQCGRLGWSPETVFASSIPMETCEHMPLNEIKLVGLSGQTHTITNLLMEQLDRAREAYDDAVINTLPYAADGGELFDAALKQADAAFLNLAALITGQFEDRVAAALPAAGLPTGAASPNAEHAIAVFHNAVAVAESLHAGNLERLKLCEWRDNVTVALGNPGGARFDDVPALIFRLRRAYDRLVHAVWPSISLGDSDVVSPSAIVQQAELHREFYEHHHTSS